MSPSPAGHDGQYDAIHVPLQWVFHAAFVAGAIWGVLLAPDCILPMISSCVPKRRTWYGLCLVILLLL